VFSNVAGSRIASRLRLKKGLIHDTNLVYFSFSGLKRGEIKELHAGEGTKWEKSSFF
jgi:hypothetical protein